MSITPHCMVNKKIMYIRNQADRLHQVINLYVNKTVIESRSIIESTSEENMKVFLNTFFKLDNVTEMLRNIESSLQDALSLPGEGMIGGKGMSAEMQNGCHQESCHMSQEILTKEEAKTATHEKSLEEVLLRLSNLETNKETLEQELVHSIDQSISKLFEGLNQENQTLASKVETLSSDTTNMAKRIHNWQSQLDLVRKKVSTINSKLMFNYVGHTSSDIKALKEKLEETDSRYEQLCLMLTTKVVHLEKVRNALNAAHANVEKRSQLEKCVNKNQELIKAMAIYIDNLDLQSNSLARHPIGFTAQLPNTRLVRKRINLNNFDYVLCNEGGNFNGAHGTFTSFASGLYCFGLSIHRANNTPCTISIVRQTSQCKIDILEVHIQNETAYSGQTVALLEKSDTVFVRVKKAEPWVILLHTTTFSGWLIR